jgi:hypothetical protein
MRSALVLTLSVLLHFGNSLPAPQDSISCGKDNYTTSQVTAAQNAACGFVKSGSTAGSSTYPHSYRDTEGFTFAGVSGPYFEFPILVGGKVYNGGMYSSAFITVKEKREKKTKSVRIRKPWTGSSYY